jgi:proline iminopeptidase
MSESVRTVKSNNHTIQSGWIEVGDGHKIWFHQWGNSNVKIPILTIHGGPGSEFKPYHLSNFNPQTHQVVSFDQRGCGNSFPHGSIKNNTTQDILSDIIKLLDYLHIKMVYVYGGSWGSTLALLFAIHNPKRVKATIVNGVFTGTKEEIDYIDKGYFKNQYPEVWEHFLQSVPKSEQSDPAAYHYKKLKSTDSQIVEKSAKALDELESPLLQYDWPGYSDVITDKDPENKSEYDAVPYKIYGHYLENNCFLKKNYILDNADKIQSPLYIVQGRYDMCCPPITAFKVHKAVKQSKLFMTLGSHSSGDSENRIALKTLVQTIFI